MTLREARKQFERCYILDKLANNDWNICATAKLLGIHRPNLYRKAKQLGIVLRKQAGEDSDVVSAHR